MRYHVLENLHNHELISTAILYGEDGLSFLGERWSYHLGKHTTGGLRTSRVSHQSSDTINSRTVLCKNEATNPVTIYIRV